MKKYILIFGMFAIVLSGSCFYQYSGKGMTTLPHPSRQVIVGCSAAGFYAAKQLQKLSKHNHVICLSEEADRPYDRTAIDDVLSGKKQAEKITLKGFGKPNTDIDFRLSSKVVALDRQNKTVRLADNSLIAFDKLLIATGARPSIPENLKATLLWENVLHFNTQEDVRNILKIVSNKNRVLIVGAGLVSLELADALKKQNSQIQLTMLNRSSGFLGRGGDESADKFILARLNKASVAFLAPRTIVSLTKDHNDVLSAKLDNGQIVETDLVIFAMGVTPNSEFAKEAGIKVGANGAIAVNGELQTNDPNIFAAGDVAGFKNPITGEMVANSKWRAAREQGQIAAKNMMNRHAKYEFEVPAYISSFFGIKVFLAGDVRGAPDNEHSIINEDSRHYYRYILKDHRLMAMTMLWDKEISRPPVFSLRRKLLNRSRINPQDLQK
jgi:NAD(P)H-nitrite reductase large subunit